MPADLEQIQARADAATPAIDYADRLIENEWGSPYEGLELAREFLRTDVPDMAAELQVARKVHARIGPLLEPIRAVHTAIPATDGHTCGWCRLLAAVDEWDGLQVSGPSLEGEASGGPDSPTQGGDGDAD